MCSLRVKALRQRSWGPLPTSLLVGVAERKISKGVKAKLTRAERFYLTEDQKPRRRVWRGTMIPYVWPCGGGHLRGERRESDRENKRTIAMARKQREKDPRPSRHAPRKRGTWRVLLLGLDLWYPVRSSFLCLSP